MFLVFVPPLIFEVSPKPRWDFSVHDCFPACTRIYMHAVSLTRHSGSCTPTWCALYRFEDLESVPADLLVTTLYQCLLCVYLEVLRARMDWYTWPLACASDWILTSCQAHGPPQERISRNIHEAIHEKLDTVLLYLYRCSSVTTTHTVWTNCPSET